MKLKNIKNHIAEHEILEIDKKIRRARMVGGGGGSGGSVIAEVDPIFIASESFNFIAGDAAKLAGLTQYTDEQAQDAVGGILDDGFTYDDATPKIQAKGQIVFTLPAVAGAKCRIRVHKSITITSAIITGDISGSAVVDIWKDTTANYPPTVADTITASAKPTLSSQTLVTDSTLTGWTKTFAAGDWLVAKVDSASTLNDIQVILTY